MEYKAAPTKGDIERLRRRGCAFTSTTLKAALEERLLKIGVPAGMLNIAAAEVDEKMPDKDPQVFMKPNMDKIRIDRMSRHLYDLYRLEKSGIADEALADSELYAAIMEHRRQYSRLKHVRYETLGRATISFLPPRHCMQYIKWIMHLCWSK